MMEDVNTCSYLDYYKENCYYNWVPFCLFFNDNVRTYGEIDEELHYFRNKLNYLPESFSDLLANSDNWVLYNKKNTRYHMNNSNEEFISRVDGVDNYSSTNNQYNMKFGQHRTMHPKSKTYL